MSDIFLFDNEFFHEQQIHATPSASSVEPVPTLPSLTVDCSDHFLLVKQQTEDPSLGTIRQLAEKQECGYCFHDVINVHCDKCDLDAPIHRVVLPMERHVTAIKLAHDST